MTVQPAPRRASAIVATAALNPLPKPFADPLLARLRSALGSANGKPILMGNRSLTDAERRTIRGHISTLRSRLSSSADDDRAKAVELAKLVSAFPQQGQDQISADLRVETYFEALDGLPAWAVARARQEIIGGRTPFGRPWGPGPIEFADLVREMVKPAQDDLRDLETIDQTGPAEREPTDEERERVAAMIDGLKADFGARTRAQMHRSAVDGLTQRAAALGLGADILDAIPDAPERSGTFQRAKAG